MASPGKHEAFRNIPSVDESLRTDIGREIAAAGGDRFAVELIRITLEELRAQIAAGGFAGAKKTDLLERVTSLVTRDWRAELLAGTRRVINATGVIIHTNLGRAPLSDAARKAVEAASGYCSLEYDVTTGKRGKRGIRAERLITELTGAEDALIVNNCAAAAFFVLTAFAAGGDVVISRGELVEIGGDFRVPDVLEQSGARLSEVGTTNRTKLTDYEKATTENTRVILRVHPSNYRIVGFTAMPTLAELAELARTKGVVLYEDIGSGALMDLSKFGLKDEPLVGDSIKSGVDIVTFSGDKLLGGPQAGIIAGKSELIQKLRKHPLYRALRVDKAAYAGLEATLEAYRREAYDEIPVLRMLAINTDELAERAEKFIGKFENSASKSEISNLKFEIVDGFSAVGGGAAPQASLPTKLVAISHENFSAERLEFQLRMAETPVIARIADNRVMIDLRTVDLEDEAFLIAALNILA